MIVGAFVWWQWIFLVPLALVAATFVIFPPVILAQMLWHGDRSRQLRRWLHDRGSINDREIALRRSELKCEQLEAELVSLRGGLEERMAWLKARGDGLRTAETLGGQGPSAGRTYEEASRGLRSILVESQELDLTRVSPQWWDGKVRR